MHTRAKIKRGSTDEETAERLDIAALHLKNLTSVVSMMNTNLGGKIDDLCDKVDAGREENREGFAMLGDKVDSIKEDTGEMTDTLFFAFLSYSNIQIFKYENYINILVRARVT